MRAHTRPRPADPLLLESTVTNAADAYNQAGDDYLAYADGTAKELYAFDGRYAYGDRQIWVLLEKKLIELRSRGADSVTILDAGCGPGTWLRRLVGRAHALGFEKIEARGFDIAQAQIQRARLRAHELSSLPGVTLTFEVADLTRPFFEDDLSVDIVLCLYGVLNHVPLAALPAFFAEIARVTAGCFVTTVRAAGSTPTIFVDSLDKARNFKQDHRRDRCDVELNDGRHIAFDCHLFTATELRQLIAPHFEIEDCRGLDLFHSRFAPDPRWNPASLATDRRLREELALLEEIYAANRDVMDRAAHLLLVAHPREALSTSRDSSPRPCETAPDATASGPGTGELAKR
jgi:SAM-dependent methyltransferase